MTDSELKEAVEQALHGEVRLRGLDINVAVDSGQVILKGQVDELAEKRLAVNLVRLLREVGEIKDQLRLPKLLDFTDKRLVQHVEDGLCQDPNVHDNQISVTAQDGVVCLKGELNSLEEKRLAGLIAWWVPGVTDVDNDIVVNPPQVGDESDLIDSVRQAFYKDVLVNPDTIGVTARGGIITLIGTVASEEERLAAEHDAYYIHGVQQVINRLEVNPR